MVTQEPVSAPTSAKKADKSTVSTRKHQRMIVDDESDDFQEEDEDDN